MCQVSPARLAFCDEIRAKQSGRQVKAQPDPEAMRMLTRLVGQYGADLWQIVDEYLRGVRTAESLQSAFQRIAYDRHREAHLLGQDVADTIMERPGLATNRGTEMAFAEQQYFRGFINALESLDSRYFDPETGWKREKIAQRVEAYLPKAEASAGVGWLDGHPAQAQFEWILGAADHCEDCPVMAMSGPYYRETLFTMPREGDTQCLYNCILDGDTMVTTRRGPVPIASVERGDEVLTHKGRWRKVKAAWSHKAEKPRAIFAVINPDGSYLRVTADHRLWTKDGWVPAHLCASNELLVYTSVQYGDLRKVRWQDAIGSEGDTLRQLRAGVPMRGTKGSASRPMPIVREQGGRESAVGLNGWPGKENGRSWGCRREAAAQVRRLEARALQYGETRRWQSLRQILEAGRRAGFCLPLPVDMGAGAWPDSGRLARSPQEWRPDRRSAGELGGDPANGARSIAYDQGPRELHDFQAGRHIEPGRGVGLCAVRPGLPWPTHQQPRAEAQVLLAGMCRAGANLYDIEVEEDESFVADGVVVHNCKCRVETIEGVAAFDPVEYRLVQALGLAA